MMSSFNIEIIDKLSISEGSLCRKESLDLALLSQCTKIDEMAYMLPEFVWSIRTYADLVVCFGLPQVVDLVKQCPEIFLSYETTFNLGDFYLSSLTAKLH
jgi:hypothetical protein